MIDSFQTLSQRFPILETVIKYLNCEDREKEFLKELFIAVYNAGYNTGFEDAKMAHR